MKKLFTILAVMAITITVMAQNKHDLHVLKIAGDQRVVTQEMIKDYFSLGAEVEHEMARHEIDEGIALFEENLFEFEDYESTEALTAAFDKIEELWTPMRTILVEEPDVNKGPALIEHSTDLLIASDALLTLLENQIGNTESGLVNLSSREEVLVERMAMLYVAKYWGVDYPGIDDAFFAAKSEFEDDLNKLVKAETNTPHITKSLQKIVSEWEFSKKALHFEGELSPSIIFASTHIIMKRMSKVTDMYHTMHLEANND